MPLFLYDIIILQVDFDLRDHIKSKLQPVSNVRINSKFWRKREGSYLLSVVSREELVALSVSNQDTSNVK